MMSGGHRILMVLVGVSLLTSVQGECPPGGWEESRGSCYLFVLENRTQTAAQAACITQGGNLTSVADEEENNFIYNLSLARSADEACPSVWLGLIKLANLTSEPTEEGWTWLDGSTYDNGNYSKWRFSEPGSGEYCARMYVKDTQGVAGEWGGRDCSVTFPYVCKRKATPSTTTTTTTTTTSTPTTTTTSTTPTPAPSSTTTRTWMSDKQEWVSWRGSRYLFLVNETFSQEEADSVCMSYGGRLASVLSLEENEFIYNTTISSCTDSCNNVWIGLRRNDPSQMQNLTQRRANWTWLDSQIYSSIWANWMSDEPTGDSACARMIINSEQHPENWADKDCKEEYPCVCKKDAAGTTARVMPTTATSEQSGTPGPTDNSALLYIGAGVGVGVVVGIIVVIIVVVVTVVKRRKKSERGDVTNSQPAPSGGAGDAGGEEGYSYVEVRPAKIMKEVMAGEGVYSEANNDAAYQDVDTASEAYVTSPPPVGQPSVTSPSQGDEYANVKKKTETAPKPSDAPEDSKTGVYDNDPVSPTTHKVTESGDEYALVTRSDTGEMTMAPPGGQ